MFLRLDGRFHEFGDYFVVMGTKVRRRVADTKSDTVQNDRTCECPGGASVWQNDLLQPGHRLDLRVANGSGIVIDRRKGHGGFTKRNEPVRRRTLDECLFERLFLAPLPWEVASDGWFPVSTSTFLFAFS